VHQAVEDWADEHGRIVLGDPANVPDEPDQGVEENLQPGNEQREVDQAVLRAVLEEKIVALLGECGEDEDKDDYDDDSEDGESSDDENEGPIIYWRLKHPFGEGLARSEEIYNKVIAIETPAQKAQTSGASWRKSLSTMKIPPKYQT